jgi:hypothetical protein
MRFSAGVRTAGAGGATTPIASIYGNANSGGRLRELAIFNTTTTAFAVALRRLTSTGTRGTQATSEPWDEANAQAPLCGVYNLHTVDPSLKTGDLGFRSPIGAAIGAGVIWTFGDEGLVIPKDAAKGIGIIIPTGSGQVADVYFVWDE